MKYEEWLTNVSESTLKKLLKTVDKIVDEADDRMSSTDIDNVKDCFNAISMIHYLLNHDHSCCHNQSSGSAESVDANMGKNLALRT